MFATFRLIFLSLSLSPLLLLSACVDDSRGPAPEEPINTDETLNKAVEQAADSAVIPAVEAFLSETETLTTAATDFCSQPSESALGIVQQQWRIVFEQWYRLSLYNFGPLNDDLIVPPYTFIDSLRLRGTDYIETVRSEISRDVGGSNTLDAAYFAGKTFQRVGLLALESAIFETIVSPNSQLPADIVAEYQAEPRKCGVLIGLAQQLQERARYVQQGWLVTHKDSLEPYRSLFLNNQLDDGNTPLNQLILAAQEFLDYLQARNVVRTAAQVSGHSWEAISATVDEVELLLEGASESDDSIFSVMQATGSQNEVATVRESIVVVRAAIADRDAAMLEITLGSLDGNFKREIPDALDVELGINFTDGD